MHKRPTAIWMYHCLLSGHTAQKNANLKMTFDQQQSPRINNQHEMLLRDHFWPKDCYEEHTNQLLQGVALAKERVPPIN